MAKVGSHRRQVFAKALHKIDLACLVSVSRSWSISTLLFGVSNDTVTLLKSIFTCAGLKSLWYNLGARCGPALRAFLSLAGVSQGGTKLEESGAYSPHSHVKKLFPSAPTAYPTFHLSTPQQESQQTLQTTLFDLICVSEYLAAGKVAALLLSAASSFQIIIKLCDESRRTSFRFFLVRASDFSCLQHYYSILLGHFTAILRCCPKALTRLSPAETPFIERRRHPEFQQALS